MALVEAVAAADRRELTRKAKRNGLGQPTDLQDTLTEEPRSAVGRACAAPRILDPTSVPRIHIQIHI